jgi:formamidase
MGQVHHLSGPIRIVDNDGIPAHPGDLLAVEICNLGPLPGDEWGFTATFDRENGGGFLTDHFPHATKAIWYFEGIYAYSPQIPGERTNIYLLVYILFLLRQMPNFVNYTTIME